MGVNALFIHGWSVIPAGEPLVEVTTVTQVCIDTQVCRGHLQSGKVIEVVTGTPRNRLQLEPAGAFRPIRALDFVSTLDYKRGDSP